MKTAGPSLLLSEFWDEPLAQISRATGLTISLYDPDFIRRSGPHTYAPLARRLHEGHFWEPGGLGYEFDKSVVERCAPLEDYVCFSAMQSLAVGGFAILSNDKLVGHCVLGWIPEHFADPIVSDHIAKQAGIPSMEVWQLIRMQPPMSAEKILLYAKMLKTFSNALLKQLQTQLVDREQARVLRIINESGMALTTARTTKEICDIGVDAIRKLVSATTAAIQVIQLNGESEEVAIFEHSEHKISISNSTNFIKEETIKIPIRAANKVLLGTIEIKKAEGIETSEVSPELSALAAQIAVALQKSRLISDLELERVALSNANEELRNLHRMKDEFLATVSHELRTPLNAMLGWAQLLMDETIDPSEFKNAIVTIERNAQIQSHLIEDLLDVSRIISGKMSLKRDIVDALPILKNAIATIIPIAEAKGHQVHIELPELPIFVKGDVTRLQQIFWNILSNSVKFTDSKGHIWIIAENSGPYLRVEISDNGKGIPKEFLSQLFDRFSQADGSHSRRQGGLGLGLAIVRHLVELHGGTVAAHSDGENKGSKFVILLPQELAIESLLLKENKLGEKTTTEKDLKGIKVLAVDDQPDSLRLVKLLLERSGASVHAVSSAREAFDEVLQWHPDLIVSDISMPEESGYDFIRRVRQLSHAEGGSIPAFALTAHAGSEATEMAITAGFQKHFSKPLDPKALLLSLKEFSQRH